MEFTVPNNIFTRKGKKVVWLESGQYPIIRLFGDNRVLVDCSTLNSLPNRQLTILDLSQGILSNDTKEDTA